MEHPSKRESRYRYDDDEPRGKRRPRNRLSCAECRRLKLKCDRVWPCSSCTKRGCARICPDGTLQAKVRSKDTSVLLAKISELENLVRQKDDLISAAVNGELSPGELRNEHQAQHERRNNGLGPHGQHQHPTDDPVGVAADDPDLGAFMAAETGYGPTSAYAVVNEAQYQSPEDPMIGLLDGIGTLNMSGDGRSRYLGLSAGSAYFDADDSDSSDASTPGTSEGPDPSGHPAPSKLRFTSDPARHTFSPSGSPPTGGVNHAPDAGAASQPHFPFVLGGRAVDVSEMKKLLPARQEASRLGKIYYALVSYFYEPFGQSSFEDLVNEAYDGRDEICPTRLALLYMIFALGVLFDPALPAMSPDAQKWQEAAETCLMSTDYLASPTLAAVQTLHLMGTFLLNSRVDSGEAFWPLLGIAMRLSQAMGLHRDGSNWGIEQPDLDHRRRTFHELLSHDRIQALMMGRPYSISDRHFDTTIPECEELGQQRAAEQVALGDATEEDEERAAGFHVAKWRLSAVVGKIVDECFSVLPPSYSVIQRLDGEVRLFDQSMPESLRCAAVPNMAPVSIFAKHEGYTSRTTPNLKLTMQQHTLAVLSNQILLFLHRRAFAQALSDAAEPMQSPFAPSVITVILEAGKNLVSIAKSAQDLYELSNRSWHLFETAYSGAACHAALLIKTPACVLSTNAWEQLSVAVGVFETASHHSPLARDLLFRLTRLQRQALASLEAHQNGLPPPKPRRLSTSLSNGRGLKPFSLGRTAMDEGATPLASGCVEQYGADGNSTDEGSELPPELGASTRLTRRNRRRTASVSTSSVASGRVHSVSSSRSRGTSFGGGSSSATSESSSFRDSWDDPPEEFQDPPWQNLSVEPNGALGHMFGAPPAQQAMANAAAAPHQNSFFGGFSEGFHPPMMPPPAFAANAGGGTFGMFPPQPTMAVSASDSPRLYPLPASVTGSPPLRPLAGTMSRTASHHHPQHTLSDPNAGGPPHQQAPPGTIKPGAIHVGGSSIISAAGQQVQPAGGGADATLPSPMNPQFDLLDTFLTWHACEQPYDPSHK